MRANSRLSFILFYQMNDLFTNRARLSSVKLCAIFVESLKRQRSNRQHRPFNADETVRLPGMLLKSMVTLTQQAASSFILYL